MQGLSIIFPFIYLKLAYEQGLYQALSSEMLLSIAGFTLVAIDFSASTFLAKKYNLLCSKGAALSIFAGRLIFSLIAFIFGFSAIYISSNYLSLTNVFSLLLLLISSAFDPTWIMIGKGKVWFPSFVSILRFFSASILVLSGVNAALAIGLSYIAISFILIYFVREQVFNNVEVRIKLYLRIIRNYYIPTISEAFTAIFTRLDVFLAVLVLSAEQAITYVLVRKLAIGFQSLAQSGSKHIYLRHGTVNFDSVKRDFNLICLLVFSISIPSSILFLMLFFSWSVNLELFFQVLIMLLLILATYYKTVIQYECFFVNRMFDFDFYLSFISALMFILVSVALYFFNIESLTCFIIARVLVDFLYIILAGFVVRFR